MKLLAVGCSAVVVGFAVLELRTSSLEARIRAEVAKGPGTRFAMADLTDFPWTELHVFEPYSSAHDNERDLGCRPDDPDILDMTTEDGAVLLVFRGDACVQTSLRLGRRGGDFAGAQSRGRAGLTPAEAHFVVAIEDHGEPWAVVRLAPPDDAAPLGIHP